MGIRAACFTNKVAMRLRLKIRGGLGVVGCNPGLKNIKKTEHEPAALGSAYAWQYGVERSCHQAAVDATRMGDGILRMLKMHCMSAGSCFEPEIVSHGIPATFPSKYTANGIQEGFRRSPPVRCTSLSLMSWICVGHCIVLPRDPWISHGEIPNPPHPAGRCRKEKQPAMRNRYHNQYPVTVRSFSAITNSSVLEAQGSVGMPFPRRSGGPTGTQTADQSREWRRVETVLVLGYF